MVLSGLEGEVLLVDPLFFLLFKSAVGSGETKHFPDRGAVRHESAGQMRVQTKAAFIPC